ncbi:MAG: exodeoxyribonuclease VII large subunit [Phycisphaerales bacterium JB039]
MTRPLFDPKRMRKQAEAEAGSSSSRLGEPTDPATDAPMKVSDLAARIGRALETLPQKIRVVGEVSGFRERTHWYFDLKDEQALVNCVMFASAARRVGFPMQSGAQVVLTGRIEFYRPQGKVSLIVERIEPVGAGARDLALKALCDELRKLGWFDEERKRPLPAMPRRVAVITSRTGAALQDVLDTMRRRCAAVGVALIDVRVQGEGAAGEITRALRWVARAHEALRVDAIILTRGGGSTEDLWAFNERIVARAVLESPIPVVAAIGHETDTTVAELVADCRAATPTQAAMRITPDGAAILEQLDATASRLGRTLRRDLARRRQRVEDLGRRSALRDARGLVAPSASRVEFALRSLRGAARGQISAQAARVGRLESKLARLRPGEGIARRQSRLEVATRRLHDAMRGRLAPGRLETLDAQLARAAALPIERAAGRLRRAEGTLRAVSPLGVLGRGYSVTLTADGRLVRSPADVRTGDAIRTKLAEGEIRSVVGRPGAGSSRPARRSKRQSRDPADQMDLFSADGDAGGA